MQSAESLPSVYKGEEGRLETAQLHACRGSSSVATTSHNRKRLLRPPVGRTVSLGLARASLFTGLLIFPFTQLLRVV